MLLGVHRKRRVGQSSEHVEVTARLGLGVEQAHLLEQFLGDVQRQRRLRPVDGPLAVVVLLLLVPRLAQPDLLQHADQQLVHVVLDTARRLDELTLPRARQLFGL